jgi:hypothetical protein
MPDVVMSSYGGDAPPHVFFIAASQLSRLAAMSNADAKALGYSPSELIARLSKARAFFQDQGCTTAPRPDELLGGGPARSEVTEHAFRKQPVAVVGRIVESKAGWMPSPFGQPGGHVGTLLTARITEILSDHTGKLSIGSEISFLQPAGEFTFQRTRFCTNDPELSPLPVGSEIALAGRPSDLHGPEVLLGAHVLRLEAGKGYSTRAAERRDQATPTLTDLRRFAAEGLQKEVQP